MQSELYKFLQGQPNKNGLTIKQCIRADDKWLEKTHDYIQWCFPDIAPSSVHPEIETLTDESIKMIRADKKCLQNIHLMAKRMYLFYIRHPVKSSYNHNSKRITRILKCLKLFDYREYLVFKEMSRQFAEKYKGFWIFGINKQTIKYWQV